MKLQSGSNRLVELPGRSISNKDYSAVAEAQCPLGPVSHWRRRTLLFMADWMPPTGWFCNLQCLLGVLKL